MFEVYWMNWEGRNEEYEEVFNTFEEAAEYIEKAMETVYGEDEGYMIHDMKADRWY